MQATDRTVQCPDVLRLSGVHTNSRAFDVIVAHTVVANCCDVLEQFVAWMYGSMMTSMMTCQTNSPSSLYLVVAFIHNGAR